MKPRLLTVAFLLLCGLFSPHPSAHASRSGGHFPPGEAAPDNQRTFTYQRPKLKTENPVSGPWAGWKVEFGQDARGRLGKVTLKQNDVEAWNFTLGYDGYSRLNNSSAAGNPAAYSRNDDGQLATLSRGSLTTTWDYYPDTGLLKQVANANAAGESFSFGFTQDPQRRHNNRTASSGVSWTDIHYDGSGQLASAQMSPGWPVAFAYDDSGNRTSCAVADHPLVAGQDPPGGQLANALDQIFARTLKYRGFGVAGSVKPKAKVKAWTSFTPWWIPVGVDPVTGAFFNWWDVPCTYNGGAAVPVESHVQGMLPPAPGKKPAVAQVSMNFVVAPANEALVHDLAGRLAGDAFWIYAWDDAGRLTKMTRKADTYAIAGTQEETLEFGYDADNRRTSWKHRRTDADGEHVETSQVLWAGCLPVMEDRTREGSALPRRWFQWGADLSGTLDGAGGIGGLVAIIEESGRILLPVQDGLGNITAVIDKAGGQTVAKYHFGPFGEPLGESGEADACPFRWQTRWWDPVCEQYSFKERPYSPRLGRWLSRDPFGEAGGFNLYAYCGNDPVNRHDPWGCADLRPDRLDAANAAVASLFTFGGTGIRLLRTYSSLWELKVEGFAAEKFVVRGSGPFSVGAAKTTGQLALSAPSVVPNAGGVIRSFIQETDQIYYRVSSGSPAGSFLTAVKPSSSAWAREALALPEQNTASFIQEVLVPAGTRLQRSRALPAFGRRGGAEQFEILKLKPGEYQPVQFGENIPFQ